MLNETLRSRSFSGVVHAGTWLLLLLIISGIGGKRPPFREAPLDPTDVTMPVPVAKMENLFASTDRPKPTADPGSLNPFITSHFQPPPAPPPPAPTTRKIELTYQGFYQTGDSPKHVLIRSGDALLSVVVGGIVDTNLFVASATATNVTLTNAAVQTNVLMLNTKKELEVPIR